MQFREFASYLESLEATPSRLEITRILTDLFKASSSSEIDKVVYLSLGVLAPNYEGVLLNLAEKMMIRTLAKTYKKDTDEVLGLFKKIGDIGSVAQELSKKIEGNTKNRPSVTDVYERLLEIAKDSGTGSQEGKIEKMADLIGSLDSLSVRFVSRIPVGRLRLGFSEKTVIDALRLASLAQGHDLSEKEVEDAYNIRPDIGYIAKLVKEGNLKAAKPEVGVPVVPMLAQRLNSTSEMIKKIGEVSVEPKFDGLRIFIHYKRSLASQSPGRRKDGFLKIFTRNMNAIDINTFPELLEVGKFIKADEVILDSEAVGLDPERERFLDFQKTIQRRRKHNIEKTAGEVPLQFQVFDIVLVDGQSLINTPYVERRKILEKVVVNGNLLRVDESTITSDANVIKKLHEKYLKMGLEGVVVKRANGGYVSGRTGWNWVKMKEEEGMEGRLADTVDCVIMGYTSGKGKRVGFGMGQFLAGIADGDIFKTVTKVGTGLTDEQFKELYQKLQNSKTPNMPKEYRVNKDLTPDFWVEPKVLIELAADEITVSSKHTAGLALRFPRLIQFREDKGPKDATTVSELHDLFKMQKN